MGPGFAFSFGGDEIEDDAGQQGSTFGSVHRKEGTPSAAGQTARKAAAAAGAFPVAGKPQLPPMHHNLDEMLQQLPSKVAYGMVDVGEGVQLPRRELWDVKVQVMAEQDVDVELEASLGTHDVRTGVYEGGFKSWESSADVVKELRRMHPLNSCLSHKRALRVVEVRLVAGWMAFVGVLTSPAL